MINASAYYVPINYMMRYRTCTLLLPLIRQLITLMEWIQIDKNVTQAIVYADDIENRNYIAKHKGFGEHNS